MSPVLVKALAEVRAAEATGRVGAAYDLLLATQDLAPRPHAGTEALLAFMRRYAPRTRHVEVDSLWQLALTEVWARPADLALPIASHLARTPAIAAALSTPVLPDGLVPLLEADGLLHALLRSTVIPDPRWERLLVALTHAVFAGGLPPHTPQLAQSLSLWAWLSECVALPPEGGAWLSALPASIIENTLIERNLISQWPAATTEDHALADHYEAAPYPRWLREPLGLQVALPSTVARRLATPQLKNPRVLIAGCGTGQQLFVAHDRYADAALTALDLSRASLAYARRQCETSGLAVAAWHCADLLAFGDGSAPYAVTECMGVLHHLPQPVAGLQALARLTQKGGLLHAAVYSRRARATITRIRKQLQTEGHHLPALDVSTLRRRLMAGDFGTPDLAILHSVDFYSTSGCRDLLLNTRERVYALPEFVAEAKAAGFEWLALDAPAQVAAAASQHFGRPSERLSVAQWDAFEATQPASFGGMFNVWFVRI